jgi:hypothetical protein
MSSVEIFRQLALPKNGSGQRNRQCGNDFRTSANTIFFIHSVQ